jgi:hypothetical protein
LSVIVATLPATWYNVSWFRMTGRIIYKGRNVSHIYLWVTIGFWGILPPSKGSLIFGDLITVRAVTRAHDFAVE